MKNSNQRLLFFGELPPKTLHGASLSNKLNITLLAKHFEVTIVEEISLIKYHRVFSIFKVLCFFRSLFECYVKIFSLKKFHFFYGVLYQSTIGIIKNILIILPFKLCHKNAIVVLHVHRSDFLKFAKKKRNMMLFKILNHFVDRFILLSEGQKLTFRFIKNEKTYVVYNCIDETANKTCPESSKVRSFDHLNILFLSNYLLDKGIFEAIEAMKTIKSNTSIILNCYGNFSADFSPQIAEELLVGLERTTININGPIYGDLKNNALNECDIILLPSHNEGLPLVLIEALFYAKPIIITKVGFIEEILGSDYPLYCEVNNPLSIILCINNYIDSIEKGFDWNAFLLKKYNRISQDKHSQALLAAFSK